MWGWDPYGPDTGRCFGEGELIPQCGRPQGSPLRIHRPYGDDVSFPTHLAVQVLMVTLGTCSGRMVRE